jgi:bifunctional non-homologous end joining protein LigD
VQFSDSFEIEGKEMFKQASKLGLEGVVSKVRHSRYVSGQSNEWIKKTCAAQRETLTIAGFALDGNKWDGIFLARKKGKDLIYAGKVDHGFEDDSVLQARLKPLIPQNPALHQEDRAHRGIWVKPELSAEIESGEVHRRQGASSSV